MRQIATIKARSAAVVSPGQALSMLLGMNTAMLVALDQLGVIPSWVKLAAAMFLEF
jgi:hypothetical protein